MKKESVNDNHWPTQEDGGGNEHCESCGAYRSRHGKWRKPCNREGAEKICPCCNQVIK